MTKTKHSARIRRSRAGGATIRDGRTVTVCLAEHDRPEHVSDNGRDRYTEIYRSGGIVVDDELTSGLAEREHDGPVVGRIIEVGVPAPEGWPAGEYADVRIAATADGNDVLALIDEEVMSVSVDNLTLPRAAGEVVEFTPDRPAILDRLAFTTDPQLVGAGIAGRRSNKTGDPTMPTATDEELDLELEDEETTDDVDETDAALEVDEDDDGDDDAAGERVQRSGKKSRDRIRRSDHEGRRRVKVGGATAGPRYRSLGEYVCAAVSGELAGDELLRYRRALATTTTADQTGAVKAQWINRVVDLVRALRPTVESFASETLPGEGMSFNVPVIKADRPTVGIVSPENTEVPSTEFKIVDVAVPVDTFGGGQNVGIATIERSSPSYVDRMMTLYAQEAATATNREAAIVLLAAAESINVRVEPDADPKKFDEDVIAIAKLMLNGPLRRVPEIGLIGVDKWAELATAKDTTGRPLYPQLNPMNSAGTVTVTDAPSGRVMELSFKVEPELEADAAVFGVRDAFITALGGMRTLQADVPATLGRDYAVYEFGAFSETDARGLYLLQPAGS